MRTAVSHIRLFVAVVFTALCAVILGVCYASSANALFSFSSNTIGVSNVQGVANVQVFENVTDKLNLSSVAESTCVSTEVLVAPTERAVPVFEEEYVEEAVEEVLVAEEATVETEETYYEPEPAEDTWYEDSYVEEPVYTAYPPEDVPFYYSMFDDSGAWACGRTTVYDDGTRDPNGLSCAVSREYSYLRGSLVEVWYGGNSVVIEINDIGNFSRYGYVMDFVPGVCYALGFEPGDNPTVTYRLL